MFYFEAEDWDLIFLERSDAIIKYIGTGAFDDVGDYSTVDYIYVCMDALSYPALLLQLRTFGFETTDASVNFFETVN